MPKSLCLRLWVVVKYWLKTEIKKQLLPWPPPQKKPLPEVGCYHNENLNKLYFLSHDSVGNDKLHIRTWKDDHPLLVTAKIVTKSVDGYNSENGSYTWWL